MAKRKISPEEPLPGNSDLSRGTAPIREERLTTKEPTEAPRIRGQRARITPAITSKAIRRKRGIVENIASMFVNNGNENVGAYILYEVLIPAAKNTIQEMVQSGIEMILFGERQSSKSRDRNRGGSTKVSYGSYYRGERNNRDERPRASSWKDRFDLSEIYFPNRRAADDVLTDLLDALEEYEEVSVANFFDAAGVSGSTWAHEKWGWMDLRNAYVTHTRGGWQIIFPDPIELQN